MSRRILPVSHPSSGARSLRWCAAVLLLVSGAAAAEVRLEIKGLPEQLEENVRIYVGRLPKDDARSVRRFLRDLPEKTRVALSALGYYAADIEIDSREDGEDRVIVIDAEPKDPVRVNRIDLGVAGPAREDGAFMSVISKMPLQKGEIFLSGDYEATKNLLLDRAQDLGYFSFGFPVSTVRVSRQQLTADIELKAESGERYTFGRVLFDQSAFSEKFLRRWLAFEEGDPFSVEAIATTTEDLRASNYFSSVRVIPQRDDRYGTTVPVRITLVRKDDNQVGLGIGYATDTGPRFSVSWEKPLINRRGHSASAEFEISQIRQTAGFAYRIPRADEPLYNYYGLEFGLQNLDDGDIQSFLSTVNVQRVTRTTHLFTQSLFVRWEHEVSTVGVVAPTAGGVEPTEVSPPEGDGEFTTDLVLPGVAYTRTRRQGAPFLTWGQTESFQLYGGSDQLLSTIDLYKATVDFRYLRGFFERNTFIGAVSLGWIESNDFPHVPVSQRFFAGGDRSIRGFKYREVSPRNTDGDAIGGRYLELFSAEYNYRFLDRWSGAVFVDTGRAFNDYDDAYSAGAGVGVRWQSPIGPFRIDVATPISDDGSGWRLHLSLGPDL